MKTVQQATLVALVLAVPSVFAASGASCSSTGSQTVSSTIVVTGTYDGGCKTFNATSALGDGGQGEGQKPYFRVENGGTVKNVILGSNGADGIHTYGNATLDNIRWTDVGEDAMTVKASGTVTVRNITGAKAADKFFQMNAAATLNVSNCKITDALKAFRQLGGSTFTGSVNFSNCDLTTIREAVFRTDVATSTAKWTTGTASGVNAVCRGYGSGKCSVSGVSGITKVNY